MFRIIMFMTLCVVLSFTGLVRAGVVINSRVGTANAFNYSEFAPTFNQTYNTNALTGSWLAVFPDSSVHSDEVTPEYILGGFVGSYTDGNGTTAGSSCSLVVNFTITEHLARVTILIDGSGYPMYPGSKPEWNNAYIGIYNQANTVLFDSYNYGVITNPMNGVMEWNAVTLQALITPGTYRIVMGANGNNALHLPGNWWTNSSFHGRVTFKSVCICDINDDGLIDDSDFVQFIQAYDLLLCDNPGMPAECKADFNNDGVVDDSDFQMFITQYDMLICS